MWKRWRPRVLVAVVIALAAALRFWGLCWGLPNSLHSYSYHPDEFLTIGAAGAVISGFFPRFYNYPSLYIYLAAIAIFVGFAGSIADIYLCARVVTALMGVAAVAVSYWAGKQLYDRPSEDPDRPGHVVLDAHSRGHVAPNAPAIGLLAALILCISPLHVQHSHFATVDVPSTLFIAACLGFAGLILTRGTWRDYLLCGAMAGLAAGTKYNAGVVVLSLIAAHVLGSKDRQAGIGRVLAALGCALLAFIISTPAVLFRWHDFWYGFSYELKHAATGHGLTFVGTGNGFLFTFTSSLWYGLGPALAILFIVAAIYGLVRLDRRALVILAFAIPYYAMISLSQVRFARYSLPLLPPAALLIAWMATDLWSRFPRVLKWAWAGLLIGALAGTLLYTIALDRLFIQPPPQDRAARWIFANIPKGSRVGLIEIPWFYSPPLSKSFGFGDLEQRYQGMESAPYLFRYFDQMRQAPTNWYVVTDFEISDSLRLRHNTSVSWVNRLHVQAILSAADYMRTSGRLRATFADDFSVLGISFGSTQSLPHDMKYPAPTIWIYERKK